MINEVYLEVSELIINPLVEQGRKQGEEVGFKRGIQDSIQQILANRFQELPGDVQEKISSLTDIQRLQALLDASLKAKSLAELTRI